MLLVAVLLLFFTVVFAYRYLFKRAKTFNKAVLITGCDTGFGFALSKHLLDQGCFVFATHLTENGKKDLGNLKNSETHLVTIPLDVTKQDQVDSLKHQVEQNLQSRNLQLYGFVSNAGTSLIECPTDWLSTADIQEIMEINCYGAIRVTKAVLSWLKKSHGRIVFVTSIRGRIVFPHGAPYTMSKFALEAYTDSLRMDMHYFDVKVSIIEPGGFTTALNSDLTPVANKMIEKWNTLDTQMKMEWPYASAESMRAALCDNTTENRSTDLSIVIKSIDHALFADNPLTRYIVGWDSWMYYMPLLICPGFLHDLILRKWFMAGRRGPVKY